MSSANDMLGGVVNSVIGGVASNLIGGLFKRPDAQAQAKTPTMPSPDDQAVERARRRKAASMMSQSGRASTLLSQGETLGG